MYIGIVGPYSTGKTTATDAILEFDLRSVADGRVTVVNCDNCRERWVENGVIVQDKVKAWQDKVAVKHAEIVECATDPDLYIAETAWTDHISGVGKFADEFAGYTDIGFHIMNFFVLTVQPATFKKFIQERCEKRNKPFRDDYWDDKRLLYEGTGRPLNAAKKYLTPWGVRWQHVEIDYKRTVWDGILSIIYDDIKKWQGR